MDLGIRGRQALVCAASRGLGKGCALALAREGVHVVITARTASALAEAADEIRRAAPDVTVAAVAGDIATPEGRAAALAACPEPDILVNNAGGPPPGDFRDWSRDDWIRALDANMLTPIELIRATVDGMMAARLRAHREHHLERREGADRRPRALERRPLRADGVRRRVSRARWRRNGVTINNLLPGPFDTDRLRGMATAQAAQAGRDLADQLRMMGQANPSGRLGTPAEFGAACAFLCGTHAGFITGQNWLLDGGAYPGTF